jgi:hypothetical protein
MQVKHSSPRAPHVLNTFPVPIVRWFFLESRDEERHRGQQPCGGQCVILDDRLFRCAEEQEDDSSNEACAILSGCSGVAEG